MNFNEQQLIKKCQEGNLQAFSKLVKLYEKKVFNIAYRMLGDYEEAGDVSQEVFLRIYKSIESFKGNSSLATWIYRVTTNMCIDQLRRKKGKQIYSLDEPIETDYGKLYPEAPDASDTPEEQVLKKDVQKLIKKSLEKLPEEQRIVIVLRDIQGFSYNDIAEITGCSLGTVKSRINRGRKALKDIIESDGELFEKVNV
ncbi:MAG: polymerase sigma-70 factor, subfamily [Thermosediminibacterales bacterium]|nr:polymerase sigma-70 factor, subfamily [Thermosediminibacterales bacterium]MDK2835272.1 polymerase sigma-70 factor, subfamily [Thermosediminibacterales bacterium]